jgi:hypothetical protein
MMDLCSSECLPLRFTEGEAAVEVPGWIMMNG